MFRNPIKFSVLKRFKCYQAFSSNAEDKLNYGGVFASASRKDPVQTKTTMIVNTPLRRPAADTLYVGKILKEINVNERPTIDLTKGRMLKQKIGNFFKSDRKMEMKKGEKSGGSSQKSKKGGCRDDVPCKKKDSGKKGGSSGKKPKNPSKKK